MQQRHCLILQGSQDGSPHQAEQAFEQVSPNYRLWVSAGPNLSASVESVKQAQYRLGQEFDLIIFDARHQFIADAFAALIGTLRAGGTMLLLLASESESRWLQRFLQVAKRYPVKKFSTGEALPIIVKQPPSASVFLSPTAEQQLAMAAVLKVVSGHRRRPLVIESDRGRGKTALLGMAAAQLLQAGKQRIIVTAPQFASVTTLFNSAKACLPEAELTSLKLSWQSATIEFIAPDALLQHHVQADLVMVDEAAAIPTPLLATILAQYSRLVFATTVHGYEGTGRGFALRFQQMLNTQTPDWKQLRLDKPIRWAEDDWLEQFSFDALLLNAEPFVAEQAQRIDSSSLQFGFIDKPTLLADEDLLRQVFGLMVLAHYRTRPSDLQLLLDSDDIRLFTAQADGVVVAALWLVAEPGLNDDLAQQVFNGQRRLKGQLLPQSLLLHCGLAEAGQYAYQRIMRIAVHPTCQQQGIGSELLRQLTQQLEPSEILGTSFALDPQLLPFWQRLGFVPVRIGSQADEVSGSQSVLMLHASSESGHRLVAQAQQLFRQQWPLLLSRCYQGLSPELVTLVSAALYQANKQQTTQATIIAFATQQRPYEACEAALFDWLTPRLGSPLFLQLTLQQQHSLISKVMQNQRFTSVAKQLGLTGRAQLLKCLRQAVADYLVLDTK